MPRDQAMQREERQDTTQLAIALFAGKVNGLVRKGFFQHAQPRGMVEDERIWMRGDILRPALISAWINGDNAQ